MRPPRADLESIWGMGKPADEHGKGMLIPDSQKQANDLVSVLKEGVALVESAYAHVSHGGPTRADAEAWISRAKKALGQ